MGKKLVMLLKEYAVESKIWEKIIRHELLS